jgi:PAS domain S-box-containing protein
MPLTKQQQDMTPRVLANPSRWAPLIASAGGKFKPDSLLFRFTILALGLGAATALRAAAGPVIPGVPFAFYYPAILVVALLCGWRFGALALLLGLAIAWYLFVPPEMHFALPTQMQWISLVAMAAVGIIIIALTEALRVALSRAYTTGARYRELLGVTSGIVIVTPPSGLVLEPQHGWSEVTGMAWPDYGGLNWLSSIHGDDQNLLKEGRPARMHQTDIRIWNREDNDWRWFNMRAVPLTNAKGEVTGWMSAFSDVHERKLARERQEIMLGEHRHRLKNLITVIDSLATWSNPRKDPAVDAYLKTFLGRLRALGGVGDQIVAADWKELNAESVIRSALAPFLDENSGRIAISGPPLALSEQTAGSLALAIHEMATNAFKYGALSVKDGKVFVSWSRTPGATGERIMFDWRETGGPPAEVPAHEGFGLRLIRFVPSREKDGKVDMDFGPSGFRCQIAYTRERSAAERLAG